MYVALILQAIADEKAKLDTIRLAIPKAYHNLIAGAGNAIVRGIADATGARINIPPSAVEKVSHLTDSTLLTPQDEIVIAGEKPGVGIAAQKINELYEQLVRIV